MKVPSPGLTTSNRPDWTHVLLTLILDGRQAGYMLWVLDINPHYYLEVYYRYYIIYFKLLIPWDVEKKGKFFPITHEN